MSPSRLQPNLAEAFYHWIARLVATTMVSFTIGRVLTE
jgi:hypothetical protein